MSKAKKLSDYDIVDCEPYPDKKTRKKTRKVSGGKLKPAKEKFFEHEKKHNINFMPKTANQKIAWQYFQEKPIVVLTGSAGVGKTMIATAFAVKEMVKGNYDRLIITRNAIGCGKSLGFFPGSIEEKLGSWLQQVISFCKQFVGNATVDIWMRGESPKIIMEPLEVVRGRSYINSIILVEEAQQLSIEELKCLVTRIGEGSLMILTGDPKQSDIKVDGLERFCDMVERRGIDGVGIVRFTPDDILRHDIVRELILAFQSEGL